MSRWLKSVNTLLENLDGQVENAVDEPNRTAIDRVLTQRGLEEDSDQDSYYSDDDEEELYSDEEYQDDEYEEEVIELQSAPEEPLFESSPPRAVLPESFAAASPPANEREPTSSPHSPKQVPSPPQEPTVPDESYAVDLPVVEEGAVAATQPPPRPPTPSPPRSQDDDDRAEKKTFEDRVNVAQQLADTKTVTVSSPMSQSSADTRPPAPESPPASAPVPTVTRPLPAPSDTLESAPTSGQASSLQQQLKRSNRELKKVQAEARQLRKHVMQLNAQLDASEAEMTAQREELLRAAERMERDRGRHNEEREDLMDEHEEELESQKEHYEQLLAEQKEQYEEQVEELQERLAVEEEKRMQEGGDWTKELEDSVQREREALKRMGEMKEENTKLQSRITKLEAQQNALQTKLESSVQNAQTASKREREAEDKLDAALSLHSRQLSQRQAREAELERTIADLGAALTVARQKEQNRSDPVSDKASVSEAGYRKQLELATNELETVKVQLTLETQRCEALRQELHEISQERTEEASAAHARQQHHDRQIADLTATVARLQKTVKAHKSSRGLGDKSSDVTSPEDVEELKRKVASLSGQLIKLQEKNNSFKTELHAVKNRLQAANTRAQNAEQALAAAPTPSTSQMYQVEGGGVSYGSGIRRRVKGGRNTPSSVRSIRSALNMNPGRVGEGTEQIAATIDAVDSWVVETGGFLRHEPLARLAFVVYLIILHLWAFCLVLFHAHSFEREHGDFGSLTDSGGLPGEGGQIGRGIRHP